ncbi:MAG: peptidoglycan-binding protein, partial [Rhizobium sp.]
MKFVLKSAVSALALSCVMGAVPAHAYTLMDMLRGDRARSGQSTIIMDPSAPVRGNRNGLGGDIDPEAAMPKVSSPRYYTYKAETLQLVDTTKFADPVVTGAVADVSGSATTDGAPQRHFLTEAKVRANADIAKALQAYYGDGKNPLVWVSSDGINDHGKAALSVLADAASVGLDPADYAVSEPTIDPANPDPDVRDRALTQFELALSSKVLAYVQDTTRGRVDPNKLSGYHDFQRKVVKLDPVLKLSRMSPDVAAYLNSRNPDSTQFLALKAELAKLRAADGGNEAPITISLTSLLRPGDSSPEVANIVKAIQKNGSEELKTAHAATFSAYTGSSDYSPEIVSLVEDFQKEHGLKPDGVIGQATVRTMTGGDSNGSKIDKLVVAMEQSRWLPDDLGPRYVMINQPAFMAYYYNDSKQQLAMRTVVGGKNNQTYFFDDEIETVEFNPFWGVPQS